MANSLLKKSAVELWAEAVGLDRLFAGYINQAAGANFSQAQIRNPSGSGRDIFILTAKASSSAAGLVRAGFGNTALGTDVTTFESLSPNAGQTSIADLNKTSAAALFAATGSMEIRIPNTQSLDFLAPPAVIHLAPNTGWVFEHQTSAQPLTMHLLWAELDV